MEHRPMNMVKRSEKLKKTKPNKRTKKREHFWADTYACPKCGAKLEKNRNAFTGKVAVCDGRKQIGRLPIQRKMKAKV